MESHILDKEEDYTCRWQQVDSEARETKKS